MAAFILSKSKVRLKGEEKEKTANSYNIQIQEYDNS